MFQKQKTPASFSIVKMGNTTLLVKDGYKEIVFRMVFDKEFLHKSDKGGTNIKSGRGTYLSIPLNEDRTERFIIRNYRHGGLLGKLLGGIFYRGNRPLNELHVNEIALQRGVPSAEVIAITKKRLWGLFYTADFISKEISGATDIVQFLKEFPQEVIQRSKKSIIFILAGLIRNMHDAGIYHADLHLKNILLKMDSCGKFHAYIIDLDKSVIANNLTIEQRIKNLLRLDRSLVKLRWLLEKTSTFHKNTKEQKDYLSKMSHLHNKETGEKAMRIPINQKTGLISKSDRIRFFKVYMLLGNALDNDWKTYIRQYHSHYTLHKLWWRISGLS